MTMMFEQVLCRRQGWWVVGEAPIPGAWPGSTTRGHTHVFHQGGEDGIHLGELSEQSVHAASWRQAGLQQLVEPSQQGPQLQNQCLLHRLRLHASLGLLICWKKNYNIKWVLLFLLNNVLLLIKNNSHQGYHLHTKSSFKTNLYRQGYYFVNKKK